MNKRYFRIKKLGFTLIEVMVTMSIISLLSSVVFTSTQAARNKAIDSATESQSNQFKTAIALYKNDNGQYPQAPSGRTISLSGRDFNVGCLGIGCILDDEAVDPLPSGTLSKYIDDSQQTIAPQIIIDGKAEKGIFLLSCANSNLCGDETYIMYTKRMATTGSCTGGCVMGSSGGTVTLSNPQQGNSGAVGGTCSDSTYNSTSQSICESHGLCEENPGAPQNQCGICSDMGYVYQDEASCVSAGVCYAYGGGGLNQAYNNETDCTAVENGHCDGTPNSTLGGTQPTQFQDPASCNGSGICADGLGVMNQSQYFNNQPACLDINNGKCFGFNYWSGSWEELGGYNQEECTGASGNYTEREWRGNQWLSYGFTWQPNIWSGQNFSWTPYTWTPNVWNPTQ